MNPNKINYRISYTYILCLINHSLYFQRVKKVTYIHLLQGKDYLVKIRYKNCNIIQDLSLQFIIFFFGKSYIVMFSLV